MTDRGNTVLVLGGARSGKSRFAENLARKAGLPLTYLATGQAFDAEMQDRIDLHRRDRGPDWTTVEEPLELTATLQKVSKPDTVILVDCLTLWVSNMMAAERDVEKEGRLLAQTLPTLPGQVIFVSNEVGQGIVPDNPMARAFRDFAGRLHQEMAVMANTVYFVTAGLPQKLK
ncbi:bifunctional adenosylcobinamide kinase/adenosylcobinamide-phosphate guanylyltransferase [Sneathiella chinensis]|uniref:Bifunctional adenosylcobalamin biosynthesis protein n=1 Tax=Sneathiella chinensis TaxID=349750 RepID=A0ABQ5U4B5_9PROT|nr:bifunctional adenosylcobinamide kinase/adenosylcobinamide-phosphate guanylyltransferase [Sneathiella chinensis]GLQ06162.1 adenosylcobinamide kinase/adenosylcobinamide phosphate guanyltransferase [Sneathiella chinensis]